MKNTLCRAVLAFALITTSPLFPVAYCPCVYDIEGDGIAISGYVNIDRHPYPNCKPKEHNYSEKCSKSSGMEEKWDFIRAKSYCKRCSDFGC